MRGGILYFLVSAVIICGIAKVMFSQIIFFYDGKVAIGVIFAILLFAYLAIWAIIQPYKYEKQREETRTEFGLDNNR